MTTTKSRMLALVIAAMPLTAAACQDIAAAPTKKGKTTRVENNTSAGDEDCDTVSGPPSDLHGRVVGSEFSQWTYPAGVTCLEIELKKGCPGWPADEPCKTRLIRVPRAVYDRCIEGDHYPRCATREEPK